jgi:hypothetical protein
MTVVVQDVKDLLDISASAGLTTATFQANIDRSKRIVDDVKDPDANAAQVDDAIAAMAAWLSYGAYTEGISQELGNISVADKAKLEHFRKVAEFFINRISAEPVDLDYNNVSDESLIGLDPSVSGMTTSERYEQ